MGQRSSKIKGALFFAAAAGAAGGARTPLTEFRVLAFGEQPSEHGPVVLREEDAEAILAQVAQLNAGRGGRLDIDYAHLSQTEAPSPEAHISAGSCRLEIRDDGIWATDIQYTDRARGYIEAGEYTSFSPVMSRERESNRVTGIYQLALTNIPALNGAGLLAASVTGFNRHGGLIEGGEWDRDAADARLRDHFGGEPGDEGFDLDGYRGCHVFYDGDAPENVSSFKGLVCDVGDGGEVMVSRPAVEALAGVMQGARGGIDVSADDMEEGRRVVSRYYALWDAVAPWDREEEAEMPEKDKTPGTTMAPRAERYAITHGYRERMDAVSGALRAILGEDAMFYVEDMDEGAVQICVYSDGPTLIDPSGGGEKIYEIAYTMGDDGLFAFGDPVELVKTYTPKAQAMEQVAMSQRFSVLRDELQGLTGAQSFSAALRQVEQWKAAAATVPDLAAAAQKSEEQRFEAERASLIKAARASGKWSKSREGLMDRSAERARKLGEDPIEDMRGFWSAQAPLIYQPTTQSAEGAARGSAPGQEEPPADVVVLSTRDQAAIDYAAQVFGRKGKESELGARLIQLRQERERRRSL